MKQSSTNQSAYICIFIGTIMLIIDRTLSFNNISSVFSLLIFFWSSFSCLTFFSHFYDSALFEWRNRFRGLRLRSFSWLYFWGFFGSWWFSLIKLLFFEIIPNSIISFISAKFTQIRGVLIATGKPAKWRPELVGENGNTTTPEVEVESCPDYPRAFPFWN